MWGIELFSKLHLLGDDLQLKPPLLLLRPLPQSLSGSRDLHASLLPGSAVVPQQLLDVSQTLSVPSLGVGDSGRQRSNWMPEQRPDKAFVPFFWVFLASLTWSCQSTPGGAAWAEPPAPWGGKGAADGEVYWDWGCELCGRSGDAAPAPVSNPRCFCDVWK